MVQSKQMTVAEFDRFITDPDNADQFVEYIIGGVYPVSSNPYAAKIAGLILTKLNRYLKKNDIGHVTGKGGGYIIEDGRYHPDVAFISYEYQPELPANGYTPVPPDLVVEIAPPAADRDGHRKLRVKLTNYLVADVTVWVVDAEERTIEIYKPTKPVSVQLLTKDDELDGGDILPGFTVKVGDLIPKK